MQIKTSHTRTSTKEEFRLSLDEYRKKLVRRKRELFSIDPYKNEFS